MTESEWYSTNDALSLMAYRFGVRSPDSATSDGRQLQCYFAACLHRWHDRLPWVGREILRVADQLIIASVVDPRLKSAVHAAAEELVHNPDVEDAIAEAERYLSMSEHARGKTDQNPSMTMTPRIWSGIAHLLLYAIDPKVSIITNIPAELHSAELLREVIGNPFQTVWFAPHWRTTTVRDLALAIERSNDFSSTPMLADALEDAGCTHPAVIHHLRHDTGHIRGCWVLDGLLTAADRG